MFLSGEDTSSASAASTSGNRSKTKRRLEISFTLQTSARHGSSGRGGGVSSRCMQHLTIEWRVIPGKIQYYGLPFDFEESCFSSHSDHRQTSLTCLLLPRPLTATAVSRPRRCSTPSPGLCSDVSEVSTHEHRVRQRMLINRLCYFPRYHFYSTTNALADIRIDSLVT